MTGAKALQRYSIHISASVSILSETKKQKTTQNQKQNKTKRKTKQELSIQNGTPTKTVSVRQGQNWVLHVKKQLMQMMFSNNSIQAALEGENEHC